jgi:DNA-binding HxlR family transcriptional regulator
MDEKIFLRYVEHVPPKVEYRIVEIVVISWTRRSSWEIGSVSHPDIEYRSSRIIRHLMDEKIFLRYVEHVPPKVEYRK